MKKLGSCVQPNPAEAQIERFRGSHLPVDGARRPDSDGGADGEKLDSCFVVSGGDFVDVHFIVDGDGSSVECRTVFGDDGGGVESHSVVVGDVGEALSL